MQTTSRLTFEALRAVNVARSESPEGFDHKINSWDTSDWFLAVMGELGEAANVAKKLNRIRDGVRGNGELTEAQLQAKLRQELADTVLYLDLLCASLDISLADAIVDTFNDKSETIGSNIRL